LRKISETYVVHAAFAVEGQVNWNTRYGQVLKYLSVIACSVKIRAPLVLKKENKSGKFTNNGGSMERVYILTQ
jgi:hypothetical protein